MTPLPMAVVQTVGVLDAHAAPAFTPQTVIAKLAGLMLSGVMLLTYACTSATVVGPVIPVAELLATQLLSLEQVEPRTVAYLVPSFAALFR